MGKKFVWEKGKIMDKKKEKWVTLTSIFSV